MFYYTYLCSLCRRRSWPDPLVEVKRSGNRGYICHVVVNGRLYTSGREYETPAVAQETACCQAYIICRNFSQLNGMYPDQQPGPDGIVQGSIVNVNPSAHYGPSSVAAAVPPRHTSFVGPGSLESSTLVASSDGSHRNSRASHSSHTRHTNRHAHTGTSLPPASSMSQYTGPPSSYAKHMPPNMYKDTTVRMTPSPSATRYGYPTPPTIHEDLPFQQLPMSPVSTMSSDRRSSSGSSSLNYATGQCRCGKPTVNQYECRDCMARHVRSHGGPQYRH